MKKLLRSASALLFITVFSINATAQNCGYVDDFQKTVVHNGNGTTTYTFDVTVKTTSGGSKSVKFRIECDSYTFTSGCMKTGTSAITYTYGPYTIDSTLCTVSPSIIWTGHTNDKCGGATCIGETITLPVSYVSFDASLQESGVKLNWVTATEINNMGFEVQHSQDGRTWQSIGWVDGFGNSHTQKSYQFIHQQPANKNYYRLKQIDWDGVFEYSSVTYISTGDSDFDDEVTIFPNPFKDIISVTGEVEKIELFNMSGELLDVEISNNQINTTNLVKGVYVVAVHTRKGIVRKKVMK